MRWWKVVEWDDERSRLFCRAEAHETRDGLILKRLERPGFSVC